MELHTTKMPFDKPTTLKGLVNAKQDNTQVQATQVPSDVAPVSCILPTVDAKPTRCAFVKRLSHN